MSKVVKLSVARISKQLREELEKPEVVELRRLIVVQPTMSKTDRLLACAFPWQKEVPAETEVAQPARFGSAFHELMAHWLQKGFLASTKTVKRIAKKWSVDGDVEAAELETRTNRAIPVLHQFLCGVNPWKIDFRQWRMEVEVALAYNIENDTAREISPPDEKTHEYRDARAGEFPGSADIVLVGIYKGQNTVLVLDHKSGFLITAPEASGQLKSLALAACRVKHAPQQALIGFLHAPGDGTTPTITCDELSATDLTQHSHALQDAFADIGNGTLRPGPHCRWCPALSICPAHTSALAEIRGSAEMIVSPEQAGFAHQKLTALRSAFKQYDDMITAEIRAYVKQNGSCPRPDGSAVGLIERSYESLSKSSILDALGPLKGAREIRRLEKLGCVKKSNRLELRKV